MVKIEILASMRIELATWDCQCSSRPHLVLTIGHKYLLKDYGTYILCKLLLARDPLYLDHLGDLVRLKESRSERNNISDPQCKPLINYT